MPTIAPAKPFPQSHIIFYYNGRIPQSPKHREPLAHYIAVPYPKATYLHTQQNKIPRTLTEILDATGQRDRVILVALDCGRSEASTSGSRRRCSHESQQQRQQGQHHRIYTHVFNLARHSDTTDAGSFLASALDYSRLSLPLYTTGILLQFLSLSLSRSFHSRAQLMTHTRAPVHIYIYIYIRCNSWVNINGRVRRALRVISRQKGGNSSLYHSLDK